MNKHSIKYFKNTLDVILAFGSTLIFVIEAYLVFFEPKNIYHIYELNYGNSWFVLYLNLSLSITSIIYLFKQDTSSLRIYLFIIIGYFIAIIMDWYFLKTYPFEIYLAYAIVLLFTILIHEKLTKYFYIFSISVWLVLIVILVAKKDIFLLY